MEILIKRMLNLKDCTIGRLFINGEYFCDTLEDVDRGLRQSMPLEEIRRMKRYAETAIPTGTYLVNMNIRSPKFSQEKYKKQYGFCDAKLPRVMDVKGYEGILIHIGNTHRNTAGCILVGYNREVGRLSDSTLAFHQLYAILKTSQEPIHLTITNGQEE